MKKQIIIMMSILLTSTLYLSAQIVDSTEYKVQEAISLLRGSRGRFNKAKSFQQLSTLADKGSARAMNAIGLFYMESSGTAIDTLRGLGWLKRAGESGYAQAWHNLGIIYKYGRSGVKQSMALAFQYMEKAAVAGIPIGMYDTGYMLYKGLGCKQDYLKAFQYFSDGSKASYPPAMYMLGLCYRNGYGVDRNSGEANYWLSKSAANGYKSAVNELETDQPENLGRSVRLRSATMNANNQISVPEVYQRIKHFKNLPSIDGTYEGALVTYDWSGTNVIKEAAIKITLRSDGKNVEGEWAEQGADTISFKAIWRDSCLLFTEASQGRVDHYNPEKVKMNFTQAQLQILNTDNANTMVGNIQMFNTSSMEPGKPMYLSLKSQSSSGNSAIGQEKITPVIYPNPFADELNISFSLEKDLECSVSIYDMGGNLVYKEPLGELAKGGHRYKLSLNLPSSNYVVKLKCGSSLTSTVVMRK